MQQGKGLTPTDRRPGGRLRDLSKQQRGTVESRAEFTVERKNARLESLESDNYVDGKRKKSEMDEAPPEYNYVYDEEDGFITAKKKQKRRSQTRKEPLKNRLGNFNAVLELEFYEAYPPHVPTFLSVAAAPSVRPVRHFCSVCGYLANYTCTRCGMRFCCLKCNNMHQETRCLKWTQ